MLLANMIITTLEVNDEAKSLSFSFLSDITPIVIGNAGCMEGHNTFTQAQPDYVAYRNNVVC